MKALREYKTVGDNFVCDVTFIPDFNSDPEKSEDEIYPLIRATNCNLRITSLIRYPRDVYPSMVKTRLSVISHPDVPPKLVIDEVLHFMSLVTKMFDL